MANQPSVASRVARGATLFEVATVQGVTLDTDTDRKSIRESFDNALSCVVYRHTAENKVAICRKLDGRVVSGSISAIYQK